MKKKLSIVIIAIMLSIASFGQVKSLYMKTVDAVTHLPVGFVNVCLTDKNIVHALCLKTDLNGFLRVDSLTWIPESAMLTKEPVNCDGGYLTRNVEFKEKSTLKDTLVIEISHVVFDHSGYTVYYHPNTLTYANEYIYNTTNEKTDDKNKFKEADIDQIVSDLKCDNTLGIELISRCDEKEYTTNSNKIMLKRAELIKKLLIKKGIYQARIKITIVGYKQDELSNQMRKDEKDAAVLKRLSIANTSIQLKQFLLP